jgi:hypothetical protein
MAADLSPMRSSIGFTPFGQRSVQFEQVVQFQASGLPEASLGPDAVSPSYTTFRTFSRVRSDTGQPAVQRPHWMQPKSSNLSCSGVAIVLFRGRRPLYLSAARAMTIFWTWLVPS